jgi:hypothetical protein
VSTPITPDQRRAALAHAIAHEVSKGSRRIETQSDDFVVLIHRYGINWIEKRESIKVEPNGQVQITDLGWTPAFWKFIVITTIIVVLYVIAQVSNAMS